MNLVMRGLPHSGVHEQVTNTSLGRGFVQNLSGRGMEVGRTRDGNVRGGDFHEGGEELANGMTAFLGAG